MIDRHHYDQLKEAQQLCITSLRAYFKAFQEQSEDGPLLVLTGDDSSLSKLYFSFAGHDFILHTFILTSQRLLDVYVYRIVEREGDCRLEETVLEGDLGFLYSSRKGIILFPAEPVQAIDPRDPGTALGQVFLERLIQFLVALEERMAGPAASALK